MIDKMFCLYDKKAAVYMSPFTERNDATAVRMVQGLLAQRNSNVAQYPEDFDLYYLGDFDTEDGELTPGVKPEFKVNLASLLQTDLEDFTAAPGPAGGTVL